MPMVLIDQQEVFAFALADGLGRPPLPHDAARSVGQAGDDAIKGAKGSKEKPGELTRAKDAPRRSARRGQMNCFASSMSASLACPSPRPPVAPLHSGELPAASLIGSSGHASLTASSSTRSIRWPAISGGSSGDA